MPISLLQVLTLTLFSAFFLFAPLANAKDKSSKSSHDKNLQAHWDYMGVEGPRPLGHADKTNT